MSKLNLSKYGTCVNNFAFKQNFDRDPFLLDIILRVKDTTHEVFRPRLAELNTTPKFVTEVIKECWAQDPEKRPEFKTIRSKLKELQRGM